MRVLCHPTNKKRFDQTSCFLPQLTLQIPYLMSAAFPRAPQPLYLPGMSYAASFRDRPVLDHSRKKNYLINRIIVGNCSAKRCPPDLPYLTYLSMLCLIFRAISSDDSALSSHASSHPSGPYRIHILKDMVEIKVSLFHSEPSCVQRMYYSRKSFVSGEVPGRVSRNFGQRVFKSVNASAAH